MQVRSTTVSRTYNELKGVAYVDGFWPTPEYLLNIRRHLTAARTADLLVIGGGGLISDIYSWQAIPSFCLEALWAILFNRRYVFAGIGVVEIRRRRLLGSLVRFTCRNARAIYCRDAASKERLTEQTGGTAPIVVGPDLAFLIPREAFCREATRRDALVNLRVVPPVDAEAAAQMCVKLLTHVEKVVMLAAESGDEAIYRDIAARLDEALAKRVQVYFPESLTDAIEMIGSARLVVAERFHVNLIALFSDTPMVALNYEGKVKDLIGAFDEAVPLVALHDIGGDTAALALRQHPPRQAKAIDRQRAQAELVFGNTVEEGLGPHAYRLETRIAAGLLVAVLMVVGVVCAVLAVGKRAVFGRGPIRASSRARRGVRAGQRLSGAA
jgi:polysaccharide pyruvyl transferase WcaK-like protein